MFTSYEFIECLIILFFLYYVLPKKLQWVLLLAFNFWFYLYFSQELWYLFFILITSVTIYIVGYRLGQYDDKWEAYEEKIKTGEVLELLTNKKVYKKSINRKKKCLLFLCIFINLGTLSFIKCTNIIFLMGISFYTLQAVGYVLDVYWNKCKPQKNMFRFMLFVTYFPQLVQGPISRYNKLSETLYKEHSFCLTKFCYALGRVLWGYFKKLVVADRICIAVDMLSEDPDYYTGAFVVLLMLFYAVQLYADFTGGIDIAIGISQALGIQVEENFIRPFFSKNVAEYWRRWHISMGSWFRDYVFYPCSISRPLKAVTSLCKNCFGIAVSRRVAVYISTVVAWFATGVWHGVHLRFIMWGLVNCLVILISVELTPVYKRFHSRFPKWNSQTGYRAFQILRTFLILCCIRLFDNYNSVQTTIRQFVHMFTEFDVSLITQQEFMELGLSMQDYVIVSIGVFLMFFVSLKGRSDCVWQKLSKKPYVIQYSLYLILIFAILLLGNYGVGFDSKRFIYNQF